MEPAPRDFVENFIGASDFWANKIRVQYKKTNPPQIAFCDTLKKILLELMVYVKEYHTTGVTYNPKGVEIDEYSGSVAPATAPAPAPAPAPIPQTKTTESGGGKAALFGDLSKGLDITKGLKKVCYWPLRVIY